MQIKTLDVSLERCVSCRNVLGDGKDNSTVKMFEFSDKASQAEFMKDHNFDTTSQICVSCKRLWDGYDPLEFVRTSAQGMSADEIREYLSSQDNLAKLIGTNGGLKLLSELDDNVGYDILKKAFQHHDRTVQQEVLKAQGWMELLAKIYGAHGNTALHEFVYENVFAALAVVSSSDNLELAIKTKNGSDNTVLHEAMKCKPAAVIMTNTEMGREMLLKVVDKWGYSAFGVAMRWPQISEFVVTLSGWMEKLAKTSYGNSSCQSLLTQSIAFTPDIAVRITEIPGWFDTLAKMGNRRGWRVLHYMVKYSEQAALAVTKIPGWMEMLADIRGIEDNNGFNALQDSATHYKVALEIAKYLSMKEVSELSIKTPATPAYPRSVMQFTITLPTLVHTLGNVKLRIGTTIDENGDNVCHVAVNYSNVTEGTQNAKAIHSFLRGSHQ